jgi:hypothetical protein
MNAVASFAKTALVLVGLWGVLAIVGLVGGVVPLGGAPPAAAPADAGVADASVPTDAGAEPDAGTSVVDAATIAPIALSPALPRARVCPEPALAPSLAVVDVLGSPTPEIVIGCGASWEIVGRAGDGRWMRVAHVNAPPTADRSPLAAAARAIDADADGDLDTWLPFARIGAGGATAGGGVFVLTRGQSGALEAPRSLAPIAAVALEPIVLGSGAGVVALDRGSPLARAPSEAWVFALGASPSRVAAPHAGTNATGLGVVDIDRDGKLDVIVASGDDSRIDLLYGDEPARFARSRTLSAPGASEVVIGDLDGDGAPDALIVGATVSRLLARPGQDPSLVAIDGAPADLRDAAIADVDRDGHADVVGWSHPRLVVLAGRADATFETRTVIELAPGEIGPRRHALADLDGDGAPEIVLLAVSQDGATRMLDLVIVPASERGAIRTEPAAPLPDAPLVLTIDLPDPNAP